MTDLKRALSDIRNIRRHVAQTTEFRGYGPLTLSATALCALLAGAAQVRWLPEPAEHPGQYVALWLTTGFVASALILTQTIMRAKRLHHEMADEMVRMAVEQFLPTGIAGVILPLILLRCAGNSLWMLPGLWQVIFGLGVFASCRCLPRPMLLVGVWFLLTGFLCISLGDAHALAPVTMSGPYSLGMGLVAGVHFYFGERTTADEE